MALVYNNLKEQYESEGYLPFAGIVTWGPEVVQVAITRFFEIFNREEGKGVKGVHTWNIVGANTLIVIGWTNSALSLQKFSTSVTLGLDLNMEIGFAIDHFKMEEAFRALNLGPSQ